jgi:hypothetical protein
MMRRATLLLATVTLSGCAGTLYSVGKANSTSDPDQAFACVQEQLKALKYQRKSYDSDARWYLAQKVDPTGRNVDVHFRQRVNRLDTKVHPDPTGTVIEIKAQTLDQSDNQQGLAETEIPASAQVKEDAQTVMAACGK